MPSDFWCDSYEIAQRCGVVQQCDHLKRLTSPITVTLMFEALCPFCQRFISNHLGQLYDQFRGKIEIELVPWGNSRLLNVSLELNRFQLMSYSERSDLLQSRSGRMRRKSSDELCNRRCQDQSGNSIHCLFRTPAEHLPASRASSPPLQYIHSQRLPRDQVVLICILFNIFMF